MLIKKKIYEMPSKKRKISVITAIAAAAVFVSALGLFGVAGMTVDRTVVRSTCNTVSEISYDLVFKDDPLYNETDLEFGDGYVTKYVDAMDLGFLYDFNCDGATDITGTYSVTALLEATYNNANLIWKKAYPLIPEETFSGERLTVGGYHLPLNDYKAEAKDIEMDTGVSTSAVVTVTYQVNVSALVGGTPVSETSVSTLTFDLSEDVLVISGTPRAEQTSDVTETVAQELIPRKAALIAGIPLSVLSLCAVIFLLVFTRGIPEDPVRLQLDKLYKRYGGRIVELRYGTVIGSHETVMVSSFKDLLLTADELKKPIFKKSCDDDTDVAFFVIDESEIYRFDPAAEIGLQHSHAGPEATEGGHASAGRNAE